MNFRYLDSDRAPQPDHIKRRDAELACLTDALTPDCDEGILHGFVCLTGPPGSGKSMLVNHVLASDDLDGIRTATIDCWHHQNLNDVLYNIAQQLYPRKIVHRNATPRSKVLTRLKQDADDPRVVVLDSANHIPTEEVFYTLSELPNLLTVCVCPDWDEVCDALDAQIRSRIRVQEQVVLDAYSRDELVDILRARAAAAFGSDAETCVTDDQLDRIAAAADGDARVAIDTLCAAAERAGREHHDCIQDSDLSAVFPACESGTDSTRHPTDTPPSHHEVLWTIIDEEGPISPGEVYERYCECVEAPRTKRTMRKYLREIEDQDSIVERGSGPAARWSSTPGAEFPGDRWG